MKARLTLVTSVALALVTIGSTQADSASNSSWPRSLDSHMWTGSKGVAGPLARGEIVTAVDLKAGGGIQSPVFRASLGWGTATLRNFLYPVTSSDHGRTWYVGGVYFAKPIAPAIDYVSFVKIFSSRNVAIYARNATTFDVTTDGGVSWHQTIFPALIVAVSRSSVSTTQLPWGTMVVKLQSGPSVATRSGEYVSQNGGLQWKLKFSK